MRTTPFFSLLNHIDAQKVKDDKRKNLTKNTRRSYQSNSFLHMLGPLVILIAILSITHFK